ncbi:MAG: Phosphoglycolate phosphatase [Anaerolineales bacterium]|nr:Phosphoglycolate phosphatase [Anaerolineales bacterium]WKZ45994.1 MAG: HAD family hydrolase [Anaerolineales bacterium]
MNPSIQAIFLDVGNTLRVVIKDAEFMKQAQKDLMELLGVEQPESVFFDELETRWKAYRKQAKELLVEVSEKELWTKWLLPDYPAETIAPLSGKLTRLWRDHGGIRIPRPDVKTTIPELNRRGYILGIIANTITEREIPDWIESDGLTECFQTVALSSQVGIRKPNPEIFLETARRVGIEPAKCAYVGDNPARDVVGARNAGYGLTILIVDSADTAEPLTEEHQPDYAIRELNELLDIFPPLR